MRRTNLTKKNKRHSRRYSNKRRINKRRSRRVRKVGGAGYSDEDMTAFKEHIALNILDGTKKEKLSTNLSSMPYYEDYDYKFDIAGAEKTPLLQGKDRIDAFNKYSDKWW